MELCRNSSNIHDLARGNSPKWSNSAFDPPHGCFREMESFQILPAGSIESGIQTPIEGNQTVQQLFDESVVFTCPRAAVAER